MDALQRFMAPHTAERVTINRNGIYISGEGTSYFTLAPGQAAAQYDSEGALVGLWLCCPCGDGSIGQLDLVAPGSHRLVELDPLTIAGSIDHTAGAAWRADWPNAYEPVRRCHYSVTEGLIRWHEAPLTPDPA